MTSHVVCSSHSPAMNRTREAGTAIWAAVETLADRVDAFDPDLLVLFGVDHGRGFRDIIPALGVVESATGLGDLGSPTGTYAVPRDVARQLTADLVADGFDVARIRSASLDHGFGQSMQMFTGGALDRWQVIPVFMNCAFDPLVSPLRATAFGAAVGRHLRVLLPGQRLLFMGTGGLSHSPPSLAHIEDDALDDAGRRNINQAGYGAATAAIDPDADREFLDLLTSRDFDALHNSDDLPTRMGAGGAEIRSWLAAVAAAPDVPLEVVAYAPVDEWITGMGIVTSLGVRENA